MKIETINCSYQYQHSIKGYEYAIREINLVVLPARILGLVGPNGSGKSTLVYLLAGLLKPSAGTILVDGANLYDSKATLATFRKSVALVAQFPEDQFFTDSLYQELSFGLKKQGMSKESIRHRVAGSLKAVGLELDEESLMLRSPFEFAGGEKRLISIAIALAMSPQILILDEPTAGLDASSKRLVWRVIRQLRHRLGISIIVVSHDLEKLNQVADALIILQQGRIIRQGSPEEVFSKPVFPPGLELSQLTVLGWELEKYGLDSQPIFKVQEAAALIKKWLARGASL